MTSPVDFELSVSEVLKCMTRGEGHLMFLIYCLHWCIKSDPTTLPSNPSIASNHSTTKKTITEREEIMADGMKVILYHQEKSNKGCQRQQPTSSSFSSATPPSFSCPWSGSRGIVSTSSLSPITSYPASGWTSSASSHSATTTPPCPFSG